jgi:hypothetical protein
MRDTFAAVTRFYDHILQVKGKDEVRNLFLISSKRIYRPLDKKIKRDGEIEGY